MPVGKGDGCFEDCVKKREIRTALQASSPFPVLPIARCGLHTRRNPTRVRINDDYISIISCIKNQKDCAQPVHKHIYKISIGSSKQTINTVAQKNIVSVKRNGKS